MEAGDFFRDGLAQTIAGIRITRNGCGGCRSGEYRAYYDRMYGTPETVSQ